MCHIIVLGLYAKSQLYRKVKKMPLQKRLHFNYHMVFIFNCGKLFKGFKLTYS